MLGGGAAGFYCALSAAREGFRTVLVEKAQLGGTAFRWGCLPVKMALDRLKSRGGRFPGRRPSSLLREVARALDGLETRLRRQLEEAGVEIILGEGAFVSERTFRVGERELRGRHVVLATGTSAAGPPVLELDGDRVISHVEVFAAAGVPRSLLIVGADVEGAEFAALFSALGCRVVLVEQEQELLPGMDRDLAAPVEAALRRSGVQLRLGAAVTAAAARRGGVALELASGDPVAGERVLVTGLRRANLPAGLERTGVEWEPDRIRVGPSLATTCPGVYAIGDVNGLLGMAHAAIQQGILLPRSLREGRPLDQRRWQAYRRPPRAVYTLPEIGGAGFTERELQRAGTPYGLTTVALEDTWRGLSLSGTGPGRGFLKLLTGEAEEILGIWVVSHGAAEAGALFGLLIEGGLTVSQLAGSLITHPTLGEALREAAFRAAAHRLE